tara:strand:+ start:977 stop:1093 length:117 start_codon:yes stop_codon:yes gene_type:complete
MKTIIIPEDSLAGQQHFVIADGKLASLEELNAEVRQSL